VVDNIVRNRKIEIHPDVRFAMLASRSSSLLGERAYKRVFDLEPTDLGMLIAFCEDLKACKEAETPEQKEARLNPPKVKLVIGEVN